MQWIKCLLTAFICFTVIVQVSSTLSLSPSFPCFAFYLSQFSRLSNLLLVPFGSSFFSVILTTHMRACILQLPFFRVCVKERAFGVASLVTL